jgi:O-antigen ligase
MGLRIDPARGIWLAGLGFCAAFIGLLAGVEPKFALAAAIAAGFALIVFTDLAAGLAIFGFFSFLELMHVGPAVSVGKLAGIFLALGWLAFLLSRDDAKSDFLSVHPAMALVLGVFLGWILLSASWATSTGAVTSAFMRYLLNAILFLITFSAVRTRSQSVLVIAGLLAGAVAAGLYGLLVATPVVPSADTGRLAGTNLDPNELASVLVAGMALSAGLAANFKGPGLRLASLSAGGFCLLAAMLTGSRGGLVALSCALIAAVVFGGRWRARLAIGAVLVALLTGFYVTSLAPPGVRERIATTAGESATQEGRTTLWQIGGRMVRAHPIEGVGAGNFQTTSRDYLIRPGSIYRSDSVLLGNQVTHNTYLQTAAELGLVGLTLFGAIIVFSFGSLVRAARNFRESADVRGEALARSMIVALVGLLAADFFLSQMFSKELWLMLGMGPAILGTSRKSAIQA